MTATSSGGSARSTPPHVVMIVGNDVTTDNRVLKSATTLSRAGARVTIVAYSSSGERTESMLGEVHIVRVPVAFALRAARQEGRARRRSMRLPIGYRTPALESAARLSLELARRDADGKSGLAKARLDFASQSLRVRSALGRRTDRARTLAWRAWDKSVGARTIAAHWRAVVPEADDYELAFRAILDVLAPDVIHAHDVHMVGVASRAVRRARAQGRECAWIYDSHEWVVGLSQYGSRTARIVAAWADLEDEFIRDADRVITVSPPLARALQKRYSLASLPDVVLNIPPVGATDESVRGIRETLGLAQGVALMVYSGGVQVARGVQTAVAALPLLPGVHLAVVAVPNTNGPAVLRLAEQARSLAVSDRVHLLDPVAPHEVSAFLASADVGLIPLLHFGSHEMALANKLFEYLHAGIPAVVSDCDAQAEFVREHGTGLVHTASDPADLARAVLAAMLGKDDFVAATRDPGLRATYSWEGQEQVLVGVYSSLLGWDARPPAHVPFAVGDETPFQRDVSTVVGFGPANSAGQAWAWAKAVGRHISGVHCEVLAVVKDHYDYPCDIAVAPEVFARDIHWQMTQAERAITGWSHALLEAGRPVFGTMNGRDFRGDVELLRRSGVRVGLIFHGSEIRDPRRHAASHRWSPFADSRDQYTARLQQKYDELAPLVEAFDGPKFVSTPDLLDYVAGAVWLPLVVDTGVWTPQANPLERAVPVVVHAPSNTALKGTAQVEAVLLPLADRGLIEYRRIQGVAPSEVGALLAQADVVIDQMLLGGYGVLACEAAALGRLVIGHIGDPVRARVSGDIPILEANPDSLAEVMTKVLDDRDAARAVASMGPGFIAEFHDGRLAASVLREFIFQSR